MIDRKKVIKAVKCRSKAHKRCGNPCEETGLCHYAKAIVGLDGQIYKPYVCDVERLCDDVIELLEEQGNVRCCECKHGRKEYSSGDDYSCNLGYGFTHPADWYCGDGIRKEEI